MPSLVQSEQLLGSFHIAVGVQRVLLGEEVNSVSGVKEVVGGALGRRLLAVGAEHSTWLALVARVPRRLDQAGHPLYHRLATLCVDETPLNCETVGVKIRSVFARRCSGFYPALYSRVRGRQTSEQLRSARA
eukprot:CAMPEP_0182475200 /NCGR_PEP_ID=MMETSP1319-20130603/27003_1 /TAXON_ID=172717 /ORGANISM="Bolidomonas pacifica, Strain RCC208" /LENGTH=131 /DNA_ID=CAMNT_0024676171 /DNA_START=907 /DNA_END=1302 /DNA_ORIENTATION=-